MTEHDLRDVEHLDPPRWRRIAAELRQGESVTCRVREGSQPCRKLRTLGLEQLPGFRMEVWRMSIDNEAYSRHMADCERRDRADDAVTDEAIGQYIADELLDQFADELVTGKSGAWLAGYCSAATPKTYAKARTALIERAMEVTR